MINYERVILAAITSLLLLIGFMGWKTAEMKAAFYTRSTGQPMTTWEALWIDPTLTGSEVKINP